jgi:hypothetical protein
MAMNHELRVARNRPFAEGSRRNSQAAPDASLVHRAFEHHADARPLAVAAEHPDRPPHGRGSGPGGIAILLMPRSHPGLGGGHDAAKAGVVYSVRFCAHQIVLPLVL